MPSHFLLLICNLQISRLETEFSSYKVRAHTLLQKKDAELAAAKDSEQIKALEEALKVHALFGSISHRQINILRHFRQTL